MKDFDQAITEPKFETKYALYIDGIIEKDGWREEWCKSSQRFQELKITATDRVKRLWIAVVPLLQPKSDGTGTFRRLGYIHDFDEADIFNTAEQAQEKLEEIRAFLDKRQADGIDHIQNETIEFLKMPERNLTRLVTPDYNKDDIIWFVDLESRTPIAIEVKAVNTQTVWNDLEEPVIFHTIVAGGDPDKHRQRFALGLLAQDGKMTEAYDYSNETRGIVFSDQADAYKYAEKLTQQHLDALRKTSEELRLKRAP